LVSPYVGVTFRVTLSASNSAGSATSTSSLPDALPISSSAVAPSVVSAPVVSGTAQQGQTLSASTGSWNGTLPLTYGYQWSRCDSIGNGRVSTRVASGQPLLSVAADDGATMRVTVTASN